MLKALKKSKVNFKRKHLKVNYWNSHSDNFGMGHQ